MATQILHGEALFRLLGSRDGTERVVVADMHTGSQGFGVQFATYAAALGVSVATRSPFVLAGHTWNYGQEQTTLRDHVLLPLGSVGQSEIDSQKRLIRHKVMVAKASICNPDPAIGDPFCSVGDTAKESPRRPGPKTKTKVHGKKRTTRMTLADRTEGVRIMQMGGRASKPRYGFAHHNAIFGAVPDGYPGLSREYEGSLYAALFCLQPQWTSLSAAVKKGAPFPWHPETPVIGVHIRKGDRKELHGIALSEYVQGIQTASLGLGTHNVFVAGDAEEWITKIAALLGSEFAVYSIADFKPSPGTNITLAWGSSYQFTSHTSQSLLTTLLVDLDVLGECSVLVGAQRSLFAWTASRLILGRGHERACPIWVGGDTSNAYGAWSGQQVDSLQVCV